MPVSGSRALPPRQAPAQVEAAGALPAAGGAGAVHRLDGASGRRRVAEVEVDLRRAAGGVARAGEGEHQQRAGAVEAALAFGLGIEPRAVEVDAAKALGVAGVAARRAGVVEQPQAQAVARLQAAVPGLGAAQVAGRHVVPAGGGGPGAGGGGALPAGLAPGIAGGDGIPDAMAVDVAGMARLPAGAGLAVAGFERRPGRGAGRVCAGAGELPGGADLQGGHGRLRSGLRIRSGRRAPGRGPAGGGSARRRRGRCRGAAACSGGRPTSRVRYPVACRLR